MKVGLGGMACGLATTAQEWKGRMREEEARRTAVKKGRWMGVKGTLGKEKEVCGMEVWVANKREESEKKV